MNWSVSIRFMLFSYGLAILWSFFFGGNCRGLAKAILALDEGIAGLRGTNCFLIMVALVVVWSADLEINFGNNTAYSGLCKAILMFRRTFELRTFAQLTTDERRKQIAQVWTVYRVWAERVNWTHNKIVARLGVEDILRDEIVTWTRIRVCLLLMLMRNKKKGWRLSLNTRPPIESG